MEIPLEHIGCGGGFALSLMVAILAYFLQKVRTRVALQRETEAWIKNEYLLQAVNWSVLCLLMVFFFWVYLETRSYWAVLFLIVELFVFTLGWPDFSVFSVFDSGEFFRYYDVPERPLEYELESRLKETGISCEKQTKGSLAALEVKSDGFFFQCWRKEDEDESIREFTIQTKPTTNKGTIVRIKFTNTSSKHFKVLDLVHEKIKESYHPPHP